MGAPEPMNDAVDAAARDAVEQHVHAQWDARGCVTLRAELAQEVPIAFEYNGIAHAVMLATPADLEDFALGFSFSEAIAAPAQFRGVDVHESAAGVTLAIEIAAEAFVGLKARRRTLAGRTGCGICGTESLAQVLRPLPDLSAYAVRVTPRALARAHGGLAAVQPLQRATGAAHVAVWCDPTGAIVLAREDVGRHNALDKLIGALVRAAIDPRSGFALVTSRASVEMVQKSAMAGIAVLAAVSAPTALAVRTAESCGQTLIGFARGASFNVYAGAERLSAG
jgi:FdhD protein